MDYLPLSNIQKRMIQRQLERLYIPDGGICKPPYRHPSDRFCEVLGFTSARRFMVMRR